MPWLWRGLALLALAGSAAATTLELLPLEDMVRQSTAIVHARVAGSTSGQRKGTIYTYYYLQVLDNLKASSPQTITVAVPGGRLGGVQQTVAGAPELRTGSEYVLFLWTSRSGLTQIIGLSQGAFDVRRDAAGQLLLTRPAITERLLDAAGREVAAPATALRMEELRAHIRAGGAR
jgi:hypothetical protein